MEQARGEGIAAQSTEDSGLMEYWDLARYLKMTEGTIRHWVMKADKKQTGPKPDSKS